jgi:hypothetical protein
VSYYDLMSQVCPVCRKPVEFINSGTNTVPQWYCALHGFVNSVLYAPRDSVSTSSMPTQGTHA